MVIEGRSLIFYSFIGQALVGQESSVDATMASDRKESIVENATQRLRQELTGASGPAALVKNIKVFWIACFACLGGSVQLIIY